MELLSPEAYGLVKDLFQPLEYQLATQAVLAGVSPGKVFVNEIPHPTAALMHVQHRYYLAGNPNIAAFNQALQSFFTDQVFPAAREAGDEELAMYFSDGWERSIEEIIFGGLDPIPSARQYLEFRESNKNWRMMVPAHLTMVDVDEELAEDTRLENLDDLLEEMLSERESTAAFLENSFGVCLRSTNRVITWCLSEYNLGDRCEIGIATDAAYRKRGLASASGLAFIERAQARGMRRIGWHCWESNIGSWATALKIGCEKVLDYQTYFLLFDRATHLAVRGDICLKQGKYSEAAEWLERAMAMDGAPAWVYIPAACTAARLGEVDQAFRLLHQAAERGFHNWAGLEENEHLASLRDLPEWKTLTKRE